jgi:hypothetical protein
MGAPHRTTGSTSLNQWEHLTQPLGAPHSTNGSTSLNQWEHLTQPLGAPHSTTWSTSLNQWEHLTQPLEHLTQPMGAPHSTTGSTSSQNWTSPIYPNYTALYLCTLIIRWNFVQILKNTHLKSALFSSFKTAETVFRTRVHLMKS